MKYLQLALSCCALVAVVCPRSASAESKATIFLANQVAPETYHYIVKKSLDLKCNLTEDGDVIWRKGNDLLADVKVLKNRFEVHGNTLTIKDLKDSDVGNYSCEGSSSTRDTITLQLASASKWGVRVTKNTNVVEGEPLTLKCEVRGDLSLSWFYENTTSGENRTSVVTSERITLQSYYDDERKVNVTDGELKIKDVAMTDRGDYTCEGRGPSGELFSATSTVRIKDKYAALWPFLGICLEVFVLCAIIFIYEKKRNKSELEESDTDQSPDQKNTPDHGKDSNLRHRQ